MAEEPLPDTGEEERKDAPDEQTNDQTPDLPEAVTELARKAGWTPREEFRGNPDKWKPADEYLLVGKENVRSMSRDLRGMRDQLDRVTRTSSQLLEDKLAERDAHWQRVHSQAVEEGDTALADRAVDERMKLKAAAPQTQPGPPPETADFVERNKAWWGVDRLATLRARTIAEELAKEGVPPAEQLREAERAIRKEFPEHFAQAKSPPGVNGPRTRTADIRSRAKGYNDMPEESRKMADDYERRHGVKKEDFARSYWAETERKVG